MSDLLVIDAPELNGVEKSKAEQIKATFEPMAKMLAEFEQEYNNVIAEASKNITSDVTKNAKRLRLDIAKVRIEAEKARKEQKEEYLRAGKAIDGVSNILKWAVTEKENKLKEIELYFENLEKQRLIDLQNTRAKLISKYLDDAHERDLSSMDEDVWNAYFESKKKAFEDKIEAEKKAEQERIAREKAEAEERERVRIENERLRKEAEEREAQIAKERAEAAAKQAEIDAKIAAEKAEAEAKFQAEIEARRKIERELQAKKEAEAKAAAEAKAEAERIEAERIEAERKKLEAGDLDKLDQLLNDLKSIEIPETKSDKAKECCIYVMSVITELTNNIVITINEIDDEQN